MKSKKQIVHLLVFVLLLAGIEGLAQQADLILTNGKIFTSNKSNLYVQALAVRGNKILAVGSNTSSYIPGWPNANWR